MTKKKNHPFPFLFTSIILFSFYPSFCTSQGDNSSTNPCESYASCGVYGSCNAENSPICSCLQGFSPNNEQEWSSGNWSSGCVRRVPLRCQANNASKEDGFLKLQMMKISGYSERWIGQANECEGRCLRNCSCIAYAFDIGIGCMFWSGTLIDIQKFTSGSGSDLYIRVANSELNGKKNYKKIAITVAVVGFIVLSIGSYVFWKWMAKKRGKKRKSEPGKASRPSSVDSSHQSTLSNVNLDELPLLKYEILANATDNFSDSNKLGKGGFGPVYKVLLSFLPTELTGQLASGKKIAVKMLAKASGQGMQEFMNEVILISKLQHRNLVRLLGCCLENKETMLIYEYMPNKSLDFYLFDPSQEVLDWRKRFNIIQGICRGLIYLHRDSRLKIIHRDLKPSNILLDNDWNPKISDFGMARIFGTKKDHISTVRIVGTHGYMAPEYAIQGRFSGKSDVFSFGVLMLEIATGRRNTSFYNDEGPINLLAHVWKLWNEDNVSASIDPRISSPTYHAEIVRCIHIGLLCVQELPKDRPSVPSILSMLRSEIMDLPKPKKSAFAMKKLQNPSAGTSSSSSSFQQSQKSSCSLNDVTLTVMDGR